MQPSNTAIVSRPVTDRFIERPRLWELLDRSLDNQFIWINSPAGSGKTILVSGYLDARSLPFIWYQLDKGDRDIASFFHNLGVAARKATPRSRVDLPAFGTEYLGGIPAFTARYFDALSRMFGESKRPVLILDNFELAPRDSFFPDALNHALSALTDRIRAIMISRQAPPPAFAGMQAAKKLRLIDWDEIRFNVAEANEFLSLFGGLSPDDEIGKFIIDRADGWVIGLVLLAAQLRKEPLRKEELSEIGTGELFNYLAAEVFAGFEPETQDVLLKTSLFDHFTTADAQAVTGNKNVDPLLKELCREHCLLHGYPSDNHFLQYHPLFKDFLRSRFYQNFPAEEKNSLGRSAATILKNTGRLEAAIELNLENGLVQDAAQLILRSGEELLTQGRNFTLAGWLRQLPEKFLSENPWLGFYLGVCCTAVNLGEARTHFEKSYERFIELSDSTGAYLSWCGVIETFLYEWGNFHPADRWIAELDRLHSLFPEIPDKSVRLRVLNNRLGILMFRRPGDCELESGIELLEDLIFQNDVDSHQRLMAARNLIFYHTCIRANWSRARLVLDRLEKFIDRKSGSFLIRIGWEQARATLFHWIDPEGPECEKAISAGLALAEQSGIHLLDFHLYTPQIINAINTGKLEVAKETLERKQNTILEPHNMQACEYHYLFSLYAARRGDRHAMDEHSALALKLARETGVVWAQYFIWLERGRIASLEGRESEAREALQNAETMAAMTDNALIHWGVQEIRAISALDAGDEKTALTHIRSFFEIIRRHAFLNSSWWNGENMARLSLIALENGIEKESVKWLIRRRKISPPDVSPSRLKVWPLPVFIYTLGPFEVFIDDRPLPTIKKSQTKQLNLLKAIIALGGDNVPATHLADILWPDADGDRALHSLEVAVHRLRKLIGVDEIIDVGNGRIGLNPAVCRVDVLEFLKATKSEDPAEKKLALSLYQGHFLEEVSEHWAIPLREKLRMHHIDTVEKTGGDLEKAGLWEEALDIYRRGIFVDGLSEAICRGAMRSLNNLGRKSEAVRIYRNLERAMKEDIGISPSQETDRLYGEIMGG